MPAMRGRPTRPAAAREALWFAGPIGIAVLIGIAAPIGITVPVAIAVLLAACRAEPITGPLFPAPLGTQWGFIDSTGREAIPPQYEGAGPFSSGLAPVALHDRWGYVDRNGRQVIPAVHRAAQAFRGDLAIVDSGLPERPFGLLDTKGAWALRPTFRSLAPGDDAGTLYLGQREPEEGMTFYDRHGKLVCGPFEMAFPFSDGRARVTRDAAPGWIGTDCAFTPFAGVFPESIRFSEGLIAASQGGKLGYLDPSGRFIIAPQYDHGGDFHEGLAPVEKAGRWLFIDTRGAVVATMPESVRHADPISEGRSLVTADVPNSGRKLGYVDRKGEWTAIARWDDAEPYHDGLARVGEWRGDVVAYLALSGEIVWRGALPRGAP
jgi:hypothetical protein